MPILRRADIVAKVNRDHASAIQALENAVNDAVKRAKELPIRLDCLSAKVELPACVREEITKRIKAAEWRWTDKDAQGQPLDTPVIE